MKERADPILAAGDAFLDRYGLEVGKNLESVLPGLGLSLVYTAAESYDGALLRIKGIPRGLIVLNSNVPSPARKRFTLAHELGHYLLPDQQDASAPCNKGKVESWESALPKFELDANRFAAEILIPRIKVRPCLQGSPLFQHIETLARECDVSLTAAAYRIAELTSHRMAIVWSQGGRARWYKASAEFERWVRMGPLSPQTFAYDIFRGDTVPGKLQSVPATGWLFERGLVENARIFEHSVGLPTYEAVLTLLVIDRNIEEEASDF